MSLIQAVNYDPATQVVKATSSAMVMTALDSTNLRLTFVVPTTGRVLVRLRSCVAGSSTAPGIYLGVLNDVGALVMRQVPLIQGYSANGSVMYPVEATFTVVGLTPGATLTWDAAYGVEYPVSSTSIRYGGPNDATASNAGGAISYEVWEA